MKKIISLLIVFIICFGTSCAFADLIDVKAENNTSGEKAISLFASGDENALGTLRPERVRTLEIDEDNYSINNEVEQSYGNPLFQVILALIVFLIVILTIFALAKKTIG